MFIFRKLSDVRALEPLRETALQQKIYPEWEVRMLKEAWDTIKRLELATGSPLFLELPR